MLRKKYGIIVTSMVLISSMLISCGGGALKIRDSKASEPAMIFGYLNAANADLSGNCWVSLRHYMGEKKGRRYIAQCDGIGNFWTVNLPEGTYQMEKFGNHSRLGDEPGGLRVIKNLREFRETNRLEVKGPGLHYFGSMRVSTGGSGSFGHGSQVIAFTGDPTEARILEAMLEQARGTNWEPRIKKRLHELGR